MRNVIHSPQHQKRNTCVNEHLDLVKPIAMHYSIRSGQDPEDLVQVGMLGLIKAAQNYQNKRGIPFGAFARPHIRGAILHYLRDSIGLIRIPRRIQERAQKLIHNVPGGLHRGSCERLTAAERHAIESYRQKGHWHPLDDDQLASDGNQWKDLLNCERKEVVKEALQGLNDQELVVIEQVVIRGKSLRATARSLGVSVMTVQRRTKSALSHLAISCAELGPETAGPLRLPGVDLFGSASLTSL